MKSLKKIHKNGWNLKDWQPNVGKDIEKLSYTVAGNKKWYKYSEKKSGSFY